MHVVVLVLLSVFAMYACCAPAHTCPTSVFVFPLMVLCRDSPPARSIESEASEDRVLRRRRLLRGALKRRTIRGIQGETPYTIVCKRAAAELLIADAEAKESLLPLLHLL